MAQRKGARKSTTKGGAAGRRRAAGRTVEPKAGTASPRKRTSAPSSMAKTVDAMTHVAKVTVAGAGGFVTDPGSQRPWLGTLAGIDPEARRVARVRKSRRSKRR